MSNSIPSQCAKPFSVFIGNDTNSVFTDKKISNGTGLSVISSIHNV